MAEISVADVDQAEAKLLEAKKKARVRGASPQARRAHRDAAIALTEVRGAYRRQEEAAGRRTGVVGGDAVREG